MHAARQTLAPLALTAALLAGCASSNTSSSSSANAVTGSMILTLEDDHGSANTRETLTMLQLPLPGLGGSATEAVEWSQIETRATADWSAAPVAHDNTNNLALVAGEAGVTLVSTANTYIEPIAEFTTPHPIASVSLAPDGLAAALSKDGTTLHIFTVTSAGLTQEGTFPLAIALGENSRAIAAIFSTNADLAVLDAGRSAVALFRANRSFDGSISLDKQWQHHTARGLTAGTWSPDGTTLAIAQRMLDHEIENQIDILTAPGRLTLFTAETGQTAHTMLPGRPSAMSFDRRGTRLAVVMDQPENQALALVATKRGSAALLDWTPLEERAAAVSFDARGNNLLVALPDLGALAVWNINGSTLRNTNTLVDTGPGVSAVAVAGD